MCPIGTRRRPIGAAARGRAGRLVEVAGDHRAYAMRANAISDEACVECATAQRAVRTEEINDEVNVGGESGRRLKQPRMQSLETPPVRESARHHP